METMTTVNALHDMKVSDVLGNSTKDVVMLTNKATVQEALDTFERYKITSCPVLDEQQNQCIGFIDVLDCVAYLVHVTGGNSAILRYDDPHELWQKNNRFALQTINKIIDSSKRDPFISATDDTPLLRVLQAFSSGTHRVVVADDQGRLKNILSQSDIIRFLSQHPEQLGSFANRSMLELEIGGNVADVVQVRETDRTIDAFRRLFDHSVSAVAVVDDQGKLVSQLSASDLREITHTIRAPLNIRALLKPVKEYVEICRNILGNPKSFLVWSLPGTKLIDIIRLMEEAHVHRVWLLDNYTNLFGLVTMTDIMKLLLQHESSM